MASFGESFVDAFAAGTQLRRQREEDARKRKLEEELATAVRPGDVIGVRGSGPAYDAARFSTDAGAALGDRPLSDFQPPQTMTNGPPPAGMVAAPVSVHAAPARPSGLSPAAQLPPALAGQVGIVRPTALAGGPPAAPVAAAPPVAAMPTAPLGHGVGAQPAPMDRPLPDSVALPDPETLVFYKDPLTGKSMAVERGRERKATPADAATSMAAVYMANGDGAKALDLMREAYDLRSKDFEQQQRTMRQAIISATTRYGGLTPQALTAIAKAYNDLVDDGVTLIPSVGPDGKVAMGLSMGGSTPDLWVDPATGGVSKQPVYADGAAIGSYINTLVSGDWGAFQANVQQFQMAKEAAARSQQQLDLQGRQVAVAEDRNAFDKRQWADQEPERRARVGLTLSNIGQTDAATRIALADAGYDPEAGARQPAVGRMIYDRLSAIPGLRVGSAGPRSEAEIAALPLSARDTYHRQGAAVDFTAPGQPPAAVIATVKAQMGPGYDVVYHPENGSYHVEPGPQWTAPGPRMRPKDIRAATARLSSIYAGALESTGDPASAMAVASRTAQTYGPDVARAWAEQTGILVAPPRAAPTDPAAGPAAVGALPYAGVAAELSRRGVGATPFSTVPRAIRPPAPPPARAVDPLEAVTSAAFDRYTRSR